MGKIIKIKSRLFNLHKELESIKNKPFTRENWERYLFLEHNILNIESKIGEIGKGDGFKVKFDSGEYCYILGESLEDSLAIAEIIALNSNLGKFKLEKLIPMKIFS